MVKSSILPEPTCLMKVRILTAEANPSLSIALY